MDEVFVKRLRAAACAGWWTILIAVLMNLLQWSIFMYFMQSKPEGILALMGPNVTWDMVQSIWIYFTSAFKLVTWVMILMVIWMQLWARRLAKK